MRESEEGSESEDTMKGTLNYLAENAGGRHGYSILSYRRGYRFALTINVHLLLIQ